MAINPLELPQVGETVTSSSGVDFADLVTNPGPDVRVYINADFSIFDSVDRLCTIFLITNTPAGTVQVAEQRTISNAVPDRVVLLRPVVVLPGYFLRGQAAAISTAQTVRIRGVYIAVPQGQTLAPFF